MADKKTTLVNETVADVGFDNLFHSTYPAAEVYQVELTKSKGVVKRGSLLVAGEAGTLELASTSNNEGGGKAVAILADDVDTNAELDKIYGVAYRTGHFNANALILDEGASINAKDKEALRGLGILLSDALDIRAKEAE